VRTIASARLSDEKTIQQLMMDIGKPATPSGILPTILPPLLHHARLGRSAQLAAAANLASQR
jgi:hypothetical protein